MRAARVSGTVLAAGVISTLASVVLFTAACGNDRRTVSDGDMSSATSNGPPVDDAGNAYGDLGASDSGACGAGPGMMAMTCAAPIANSAGCGTVELCGSGAGNGLDDNCDGKVDETCTCTPGDVEKCFAGPPGKHNIGACTDGTQTCSGVEFGSWGPCTGSISPRAETCDAVDNDCNGCADDGLCCDAVLECPGTVADAAPYTDVKYMGGSYYHGTGTSTWSWTVTGGPCDQLFLTTTGTPPVQSFTVTGANTANPTLKFTLSGDYTVTMTVTDASGQKSTCTWVQHVSGPGVRFELCWDTSGSADIDLHVHRPNSTTDFFKASGGADSKDDCDYRNCNGGASASSAPSWGYANSPLVECSGGPSGFLWNILGYCRNPRLDIDNIFDVGKPENINIDAPKDGETFRTLVHYFSGTKVTHPLVNIYCGGHLKATYGQAPDLVTGFANGGDWAAGDMWRVADVKAIVNTAGVTTDCTVTGLHPISTTSGYRVGHDNKISYEGN